MRRVRYRVAASLDGYHGARMTWRGLWLCSAVFAAFAAAYQLVGIEPSRPAALLFSYGPPAAVAVWVDADARRRRRSPCWDLGIGA